MRHGDPKAGWSLMEVLLIVLLLAILAVMALPRIYDYRTKAIEASEAYIIGAVQEGINIQKAEQILNP